MSTRQHSAHCAPVLSSAANCWQTLWCDLLKLIIFKSCSISAFDPRTCLVFYWSGVRYCLIICSAYWPHPHYPRNQQRGCGQAVYHENNKQCQHYPQPVSSPAWPLEITTGCLNKGDAIITSPKSIRNGNSQGVSESYGHLNEHHPFFLRHPLLNSLLVRYCRAAHHSPQPGDNLTLCTNELEFNLKYWQFCAPHFAMLQPRQLLLRLQNGDAAPSSAQIPSRDSLDTRSGYVAIASQGKSVQSHS